MTAFHITPHGLEEIRVGRYLTINGERRRVVAWKVEPAKEDDDHLGIKAGDPITTVVLARADVTDATVVAT